MKLPRPRTIVLLAAAAAIAVTVAVSVAKPRCTSLSGNADLAISGDSLSKGGARFFCYRDAAGERLRFVLARGTDGKVRSMMDACAQCYTFHKGFTASAGELVCRLCGNHYPINNVLAGKASCVPVAIPNHESGGSITINTADLRKHAWLF